MPFLRINVPILISSTASQQLPFPSNCFSIYIFLIYENEPTSIIHMTILVVTEPRYLSRHTENLLHIYIFQLRVVVQCSILFCFHDKLYKTFIFEMLLLLWLILIFFKIINHRLQSAQLSWITNRRRILIVYSSFYPQKFETSS